MTQNLYLAQFSASRDLPPVAATRTVIIASTPRSGSHMLGHSLAMTGLLGQPFEYCNRANLDTWRGMLGIDDDRTALRAIMLRRTSPNGVFSIKIHHSQAEVLGGVAGVLDFFPNPVVVCIRRADVLRQAISYSIARQTGVWISGQQPTSQHAIYDPSLITACLQDIAMQNALWESDLSSANQPVEFVEFDEFRRAVAPIVRRIAVLAGVSIPNGCLPESAPTKSQSDAEMTKAWIAAYGRDLGNAAQGWRARARRLIRPARK